MSEQTRSILSAVLMFLVAGIQFTVKTPPSFMSAGLVEVLAWVGGLISLALSIFFASQTTRGQIVVQALKRRLGKS